MNDLELLRRYAAEGDQAAFKAVVGRHIDLVYSAAKRQVRSPDLAFEVAQTVFLDLAAGIRTLRDDTHPASWLLVATRRRAIDVVRREATRQRLERRAAEDRAVNAPSTAWPQLEPLLDEALGSLHEDDRRAIVLRFFENLSLREVSERLGCSEDGAQKRVSRALDRLRGHLADRGLVTVAAVLASELAAHATQPAPAGMGLVVSDGVLAELTRVAAQHAARAGIVTVLKVAVATAALAGAAMWLSYQAYVVGERKGEAASLAAVAERLRGELGALRTRTSVERRAATKTTAETEAFVSSDPAFDARVRTALAHLAELRQRFAANPRLQIPEMRLLSTADWFRQAQTYTRWETDADWSEAMAGVRIQAINNSGGVLERALQRYVRASEGKLPTSMDDLAPLCDPALGPDILARYALKRSGLAAQLPDHAIVIAERPEGAADPDHDNLAVVGLGWSGVTNVVVENSLQGQLRKTAEEAVAGYRAAHGGKDPPMNDPEVLRPYISDPKQADAFIEIMRQITAQMPHFKEENAAGLATNAYVAAHHGQQPASAKDLVPYFKYPEDAAEYMKLLDRAKAP